MKRISVRSATSVADLLWPEFVREHGCVFLGRHGGSNPPPPSDTATGWEAFINHTHILDEFTNRATHSTRTPEDVLDAVEETYDQQSPDFMAACRLGQRMAKLWAMKLKQEFPKERFRVYYTEYDNPIVRFHTVRDSEALWLTDDGLRSATDKSFENALIYDTEHLDAPVCKTPATIH